MAGKKIQTGTLRLQYVFEKLSKNTLADILILQIRHRIGADATDEQICQELQPWLDAACEVRKDRGCNLTSMLQGFDHYQETYRKQHGA